MAHHASFKQQVITVNSLHPWEWMHKWNLSVQQAADLLNMNRGDFYRWNPHSTGKRIYQPAKAVGVACAVYDQLWQKTGFPY